ncbi:MAG: magnesium transporter [Betaproteobacteria bacterium]|nr:magnesium transporter [Betaproteobacteria bacterium]
MAVKASPAARRIPFEIAAERATPRVPVVAPTATAGELRRVMEGRRYESASHIVVCEGERFAGVLRIEDLLAAPEATPIGTLMDREAPTVAPGVDQEVAAWRAVQHGESALAVVDAAGRFVGIIPPHQLLAVLLWEHDEDMARLGGFLKRSSSARQASVEPVRRRFWHRVPWLLLGLAGALLAADIVGWFETRLQEKLILAFFIPGIVYLADAVGTQTETVVVRGLSVGVSIGRVVWRELLTGLGIGLALAATAFPVILWRWGDADLALGVSLSIFATCSTATVVAMALPWAFTRFDSDPAFGSGPLATVIQDLLSINIMKA